MPTKLIEIDGVFVEVEIAPGEVQQISGGFVDKVNSTFNKIQPLLIKSCRPIMGAWKEINKDVTIQQAEVELGLGFEGEGNIYITKSKATANITIKLILKPKSRRK